MDTISTAKPTQAQPTELSWETLERQDWHLWILAILLMFVLGVSLVSFMLPSVFWFGKDLTVKAPQRAFFGFCLLLALVLVYLLQRQAAVRRLKRQLFEAQAAVVAAERKTVVQAFLTLPGTGQLRDALAMEYRRASTSGTHLAVVLLTAANASLETLGRISNQVRHMLRRGESLYRVSEKAVAVILPGMLSSDARSFAAQAEERIGVQQGELEVTITAYPEEVASFAELEARLVGRGV